MNTARMNSLLSRQKKSLIADALYALVVAIAMVIYLLGLGLGTSAARVGSAPATPAERSLPAAQADACMALPGLPVASAAHRC